MTGPAAATAHAALGIALSAYRLWVAEPGADQDRLHELLRHGTQILAREDAFEPGGRPR